MAKVLYSSSLLPSAPILSSTNVPAKPNNKLRIHSFDFPSSSSSPFLKLRKNCGNSPLSTSPLITCQMSIRSSQAQNVHHAPSTDISSIKIFSESNDVASIPSIYHSLSRGGGDDGGDDVADHLSTSIPVLDFSLLISNDPQIHANAVQELGKACQDWKFFMIINHGIPENIVEGVMKKSMEFHNLAVEEKEEFKDEGLFPHIKYGTGFYNRDDNVQFWRDYLRIKTFPDFHFPHKPPGFKEVAYEYTRKTRSIVRTLLEGVSESLGLEPEAIIEYTDYDNGIQKFLSNLYPPCPRPDIALGLPVHTDNGFFTILTQNEISGLQIKHGDKWVTVHPLRNCLLAIPGDQLELVTNGRYKSIWHRAMLNNEKTRATLAILEGPPLEKEIGPMPKLLEKEKPLFKSIKFKDFVKLKVDKSFEERTLDYVAII